MAYEEFTRPEGLAIVVSGPSGVGKDTILAEFLKCTPTCTRLVTVTTRPKRESEQHGREYFFVSEEEFERMKQDEQFIETAVVYKYNYGSPRWFVEEKRREGLDVILRIDVQGAESVRERVPGAILIFIAPPSIEALEERLRSRNTEDEESLQRRLDNVDEEMETIPFFDYIVVNDTVEQAVEDITCIYRAERMRIRANV